MFGKADFWGVGEIEGQKVIFIWWLKLFLFVFMIIKQGYVKADRLNETP